MMIKVTEAHVKIALIDHLVKRLEQGEIDELVESGVSPEALDKFRTLDTSSRIRLVELGFPDIHFCITEDSINAGMNTLQRENIECNDLVYFIINGAGPTMLDHFFRLSKDKILIYRKLFAKNVRAGRTTLPSTKIRDEIHMHWHSISKNSDNNIQSQRSNLRTLHQKYNEYAITTLYATITEFGKVNT